MMLSTRIFRFYINSSIHVALAVLALAEITVLEFGLEPSYYFRGFLFFGVITGYNFVKYAEVAGLHHRSLAQSLKTIQVFSFLCFALLVYFSWFIEELVLMGAGILGLFTLLYAVPVWKGKSLRTINGLKIYIVALVWAGTTIFLPVVASEEIIRQDHIISFLQRVLIVLVLTLPFEIRDLRYDVNALGTIPQRIGVRKTKILGIGLLLMSFVLEFSKIEMEWLHLCGLLIMEIFLGTLLWVSKKYQPTYFASFWIEGIPIFWLGVYFLLMHFFT
jgi:hypothetical protein